MLAADRGCIDKTKAVALFFIARADIGRNARAGQTVDRLAEGIVIAARSAAIRKHEQVVARNLHALADFLVALQLFHDLRDAVDQDVLVVDGRKALTLGTISSQFPLCSYLRIAVSGFFERE